MFTIFYWDYPPLHQSSSDLGCAVFITCCQSQLKLYYNYCYYDLGQRHVCGADCRKLWSNLAAMPNSTQERQVMLNRFSYEKKLEVQYTTRDCKMNGTTDSPSNFCALVWACHNAFLQLSFSLFCYGYLLCVPEKKKHAPTNGVCIYKFLKRTGASRRCRKWSEPRCNCLISYWKLCL